MRYFFILLVTVFCVVVGLQVSTPTTFADVNIVPSPNCLSGKPCVTNVPSTAAPSTTVPSGTTVSGQPSSSPSSGPNSNPSPSTSAPCFPTSQSSVSSQSTGTVSTLSRHHAKHHHSAGGGLLQQFIQLLWQFLQKLFQQFGIQLPNISPCSGSGSTQSPSGTPGGNNGGNGNGNNGGTSGSPSSAPSTAAGGGSTGTSPAPSSAPATTTSSGFITASGTKLMLNGKQFRSFGLNFSAVGACWSGTNWTTSQMDTFFAALPKDALARFFAPPDNTDSASFVQSVVKEADKYNIHLIISLADADVDNNCDPEDASGNGKSTAYYTNAVQSGSTYYNWVQSVVKPLANDPGVGMWEIVNEPFHSGATYDQVSAAAAANYVKTAASIIRALDKNHLITMGTVDIGETGGTSGMQTLFGYLDVVNDHDYAWDYQNKATISSDFAQEKQVAQALNKPFMVDEAGVEGGSSCNGSNGLSLADRVTYLTTKANDYLSSSGGASALVIWLYTGDTTGGCAYENINTSDPLMAAIKNYTMPN